MVQNAIFQVVKRRSWARRRRTLEDFSFFLLRIYPVQAFPRPGPGVDQGRIMGKGPLDYILGTTPENNNWNAAVKSSSSKLAHQRRLSHFLLWTDCCQAVLCSRLQFDRFPRTQLTDRIRPFSCNGETMKASTRSKVTTTSRDKNELHLKSFSLPPPLPFFPHSNTNLKIIYYYTPQNEYCKSQPSFKPCSSLQTQRDPWKRKEKQSGTSSASRFSPATPHDIAYDARQPVMIGRVLPL